MELAQVRYFVTLCDERNFSRAARRCGVSQPSLSNGIKKLECELGGKLFERAGMSLTPLGKSMRPQFESVVAAVRQITKRATAFHRRQASRHRVAAAPSPTPNAGVLLNGAQSFEEGSAKNRPLTMEPREVASLRNCSPHLDREPEKCG